MSLVRGSPGTGEAGRQDLRWRVRVVQWAGSLGPGETHLRTTGWCGGAGLCTE